MEAYLKTCRPVASRPEQGLDDPCAEQSSGSGPAADDDAAVGKAGAVMRRFPYRPTGLLNRGWLWARP
jgi:hypothetical protein